MVEENKNSDEFSEKKADIKYHVLPNLEYCYRDLCNVFVSQGDVVLEFGNKNRAIPGHATISNRIVLSISNAYSLQETLQKALQAAQLHMQQQMKKET